MPQRQAYISPEEFLEIRRNTDDPIEYFDGQILARDGSSRAHGQVVTAVTTLVSTALFGKPCESSSGISVAAPTSYFIPDLVVYCDGGDFTPSDEILRNPLVLFEVLSPSTERFDRGPKWMRYQQLASLMHYVLISQSEPFVEVYTRDQHGGWHYDSASELDGSVVLTHLQMTIPLAEIYQRVVFPPQSETTMD